MMNSNAQEDEFAPNPFRTAPTGGMGAPPQQQNNFYGSPMTASNPPVDPFAPVAGPPQQQPMMSSYGQGQMQQMPMQQQQFAPQQSMYTQTPTTDPSQWSGAMDQRAAPVENYGGTGATAKAPSNSPFGSFGWQSCVNCFRMDSYVAYFDMDTADIIQRLKASLVKFYQPDQFRTAVVGDAPNEHLKGPDLYGPLWISMTLIFVIAVTSNIHAYWEHVKLEKKSEEAIEEFEVDIHHLVRASSIVLFFVFGMSTAFWMGTSCLGMPNISWAMWVCCYGYSQVPFLVATIFLSVFATGLITWIVLAAATGASVLLVLRNLSTPLLAQDSPTNSSAPAIIMGITGVHVIYFFVLKVVFYS